MTIDEAIRRCEEVAERYDRVEDSHAGDGLKQECEQCAADHRQLAEWLTELKEAKRLLKLAVEDFTAIAEVHAAATPILCPQYGKYMKAIDVRTRKWQYADEALKLIGDENDAE